MMDRHVPPHQVWSLGSQTAGMGDVRAGAVAEGGAKRSVMILKAQVSDWVSIDSEKPKERSATPCAARQARTAQRRGGRGNGSQSDFRVARRVETD